MVGYFDLSLNFSSLSLCLAKGKEHINSYNYFNVLLFGKVRKKVYLKLNNMDKLKSLEQYSKR